jgi:hypothetical protein
MYSANILHCKKVLDVPESGADGGGHMLFYEKLFHGCQYHIHKHSAESSNIDRATNSRRVMTSLQGKETEVICQQE